MGLIAQVEIKPIIATWSSMAEFFTPQACDETMLVRVAPFAQDDLFVHHFQTDQLMAVQGSFVLVVLQNRQYRYIPMFDTTKTDLPRTPVVVKIPPNVPHGAINFSAEPCLLVNAVIRHGGSCAKDYQPLRRPFPYDLDAARAAWAAQQLPSISWT
jgi:hypothetical protein